MTPARFFDKRPKLQLFAYWLHGTGALPVKEATIFETGSNPVEIIRGLASPIGDNPEQAPTRVVPGTYD